MAKKIALLFAGQGAQCVGMGRDLAERYPVAGDLFLKADEILGRNLCDIAWNGPMEELTKTSNCQPALYVHALAALAAVREVFGELEVGGAAGLSLGEITAHAAAGTFDFATGLKLVQKRGEFMRLDEQSVGDDGSKPAQCRDESELPKLFAKIEIEFDAAEMFLTMKSRKIAFDRQFEQPHHDQHCQRDQASRHSSFP